MAKSSFAKPGTAPAKPTASAAKPAPARSATPAKPTPTKPAGPAKPAAQVSRTAPAKPTPTAPAGVRTNVGAQPARPALPQRRAAAPPAETEPELPLETGEEQAPTEVAEENLPVETKEGESSVANLMQAPMGQLAGVLDQYDFEIPFLKLGQSVGPLTEELGFSPGDWVAANSVILWQDGCEEVTITICRAQKQWVENLPYGADEMPRIFQTPEDVTAAGLSLTWGPDNEAPGAMPQVNALCMVKKNEGITDDGGIFNLEGPDGMLYALLMWRISGVAYGRVVKKMTGALRTRLKDGLHTGTFLLSAKKEKGKVNTYWVPILDPGDYHDEAMLNFCVENAGG